VSSDSGKKTDKLMLGLGIGLGLLLLIGVAILVVVVVMCRGMKTQDVPETGLATIPELGQHKELLIS
jgi:hypothetical protein